MRNIPNIAKSKILLGIFLFISSCYHPKTHGTFISESQDAWIDGYAIRINEHKIADKGLVFVERISKKTAL